MTLAAYLAGVSDEDEAKCDAWMAAGNELRAAVGWRYFQGKASVLEAVTGIPADVIRTFVETGEITNSHRRILEMYRDA